MKQRTKNISIILAVLIVAAIGVAVKIYGPAKKVSAPTGGGAVVERPYTNAKGEKWGPLPEGPWAFQVTSAAEEVGPKFLEGEINPVKVAPGSTQKMRIVVQSLSGIASVIAYIETDNGTTTVPLKKTGVITWSELMPERYIVENNVLKVLSPIQIQARFISNVLADQIILPKNIAHAATGDKEVWEGSWVVRDTHERDYITVFVARDNSGNENNLTLAWSDPCETELDFGGAKFPTASSAWAPASCTLTTSVIGVENNDVSIGSTVNVNLGSSVFVWNPGYKITIANGGSITINTGSLVQDELVWMDPDGDGWVVSGNRFRNGNKPACSSPCVYRRQDALSGSPATTQDCYDSSSGAGSANTHPGQTAYFTTANGLGSFDYDCNGTSDLQYPVVGSCHTCDTIICPPTISYGGTGFLSSVPGCGSPGTLVTDPGYCDANACVEYPCQTTFTAQACR